MMKPLMRGFCSPHICRNILQTFSLLLINRMSETQYWDSDCLLARYYREADQLKQERINQNAWLQGMYIYDAVSRLSPILHAFAKKGTKAKPYPSEPYPINERTKKEADNHKEKAKLDKGLLYMQQFKAKSEIYFKEREGK